MPRIDFDNFRERLLSSGVALQYVGRAVSELRDHCEDIESEIAEHGVSPESAEAQAIERIGAIEVIAQQYLSKPDLKCWAYRHPRMARAILPVANVLILPLIPVFAGVENAQFVTRWCACLLLSAFVTATMLLLMQISIAIA